MTWTMGLILSLATTSAHAATWPVWRGSKERTAVASGEFASGEPQVQFRLPLGGEPTRSLVFPEDTPGTLLSAIGGKVQAIDVLTGAIHWETAMLQELTLVGSADLDGDGLSEVVAFTKRQAYVFSPQDGSVRWSSVLGEHSTIAAVRLADVTGDGLAEVLIDDCATCGVPGPLHGEVVSFASGVAQTLWTVRGTELPQPYHQGSDAVLLGLGSGRPLLGLPTVADYRLVDGATGHPLIVIPRGEYWFAQTSAMVAGNDQVLLFRPTGNALGALPPVVISLGVSPDEQLGAVAWQYAGEVSATLELSETAIADLDGDDVKELVVSERGADGQWSLVILDLESGAVLERFTGWRLEAVLAESPLDGLPALALTNADGLTLATYRDRTLTQVGDVLLNWETTTPSGVSSMLVPSIRPALCHDLNGSGRLLLGKTSERADSIGRYESVAWADITAAGLQLKEAFTPPNPITGVYRADGATRPYTQFAAGMTDGSVTVLDKRLRPSSGSLYQTNDRPRHSHKRHRHLYPPNHRHPSQPQHYAGTPVGGRQPGRANLIGQVDGNPFLVVPNTALGTIAADVRHASRVSPAELLWSSPSLIKPSIFQTAEKTVVAGVEGDALVLRDAQSGAVTAQTALDQSTLGPIGTPHHEPLLLERDDGSPIITLDWQLPAVQMAQRGFQWDAEGLTEAWTSEPMTWGGGFFSSGGRYQFDNTTPTTDILVFATNSTTSFRRADTGEAVSKKVYTGHYTLPIIADFTGDGASDILFQAGFLSPWLYGPNWTQLWVYGGPLPTYTMAGALIPCEAGNRYVTPYLRSSRFLVFDARTGSVLSDSVAASGALFTDEASAELVGARAGFLSNMSVLHNENGESLILFGSTDGYLYAVDGCGDRGIVWAMNAGTPLGEPSIGDWDADGKEEVAVGAATGHILGVDFGRLTTPAVDVSHMSHRYATVDWDAVAGATAYEYALVQPDGQPVWDPPYRQTRRTRARVDLDDTLAGRPFRVAVRALYGADATAQSGTQSGAEGFSPPLTRSDLRAPHVHAGADHGNRLWFGAADDQELDHYLVWGVDDAGERTLLDDGFVQGRFGFRKLELPNATRDDYRSLIIGVSDAAGNKTETSVLIPRRPLHAFFGKRR